MHEGETMAVFESISSPNAPQPVANYSHATRVGDMVFLAGQGGFDPGTGQLAGPDIVSQTRQALTNLQEVLGAAGLDFSHVVSIRYFLTDHALFPEMNAVHATFFPEPPFPARTTVTTGLGPNMVIEIDAIAYAGK